MGVAVSRSASWSIRYFQKRIRAITSIERAKKAPRKAGPSFQLAIAPETRGPVVALGVDRSAESIAERVALAQPFGSVSHTAD